MSRVALHYPVSCALVAPSPETHSPDSLSRRLHRGPNVDDRPGHTGVCRATIRFSDRRDKRCVLHGGESDHFGGFQ